MNPNRARAREWRTSIARGLLADGSPEKSGDFANVIEGVRSDVVDLRNAAKDLLQKRQRTSKYLRGQLGALQQIMSALVDRSAIKRQIARWSQGYGDVIYDTDFRASVLEANSALTLVPQDLLAALKRRDVDIHGSVLSGYAMSVLRRYELVHARNQQVAPSPYHIENLKRILSTTDAILDAKPEQVFPDVAQAIIHNAYDGRRLQVTRENRLELRKLSDPAEVVSVLPLAYDGNRQSEVTQLHRKSAILTHDRSGLLAWQPEAADEPVAELLVEEAYGVNGIANRSTPEGLQTFVATTSGTVYQLLDLKLQRKWQPLENDFVSSPVVTSDGRPFALAAKKDVGLVELVAGQEARTRMAMEGLHEVFRNLPALSKFWEGRLKEEYEGLKKQGFRPEAKAKAAFDPQSLSWSFPGMLALELLIDFLGHNDSAVLFLDAETLTPDGYVYVEDRIVSDFAAVEGADGSPRIFVTLLSDFELSYDLVKWFRGARTPQGWVFVPEGSTLRTRDDLVELCMADGSEGFAADDSGGLFQFSAKTGEYREIGRDKGSRISGLAVVE